MIALRPLRWPEDRKSLRSIDTSFTTGRVFRLDQTEHFVKLEEVLAEPPIQKSYAIDMDALPNYDWVQIAEHDQKIAGIAAMRIEAWNRRAVLQDLYVTKASRGVGIGQALVAAAFAAACDRKARCLWVETQTINYPAIQFYRRAGFSWCGFDTSLYDNDEVGMRDVALFLSRGVR